MSSVVRVIMLSALVAITASSTNPAWAQSTDPEAQATIEQARKNLGIRSKRDCGKADQDGAIIVCGRSGENPNRLPLPDERSDLAGKRLTGDIPAAGSINPKVRSCGVQGNPYGCNGGIPIQRGFEVLVNGLTKLIDPDAAVEDAPTTIPKKWRGTNQ